MMKAGAERGASGENAIIRTVAEVDVIIGPIAITLITNILLNRYRRRFHCQAPASAETRDVPDELSASLRGAIDTIR